MEHELKKKVALCCTQPIHSHERGKFYKTDITPMLVCVVPFYVERDACERSKGLSWGRHMVRLKTFHFNV